MLETVFVGSRTDMFRKGVPDGRSDDWECSLNEPRPYLEYITWRNDLTLLWNWMMALSWHTHWAGDARILTFHPPKIMHHTAQNEDHTDNLCLLLEILFKWTYVERGHPGYLNLWKPFCGMALPQTLLGVYLSLLKNSTPILLWTNHPHSQRLILAVLWLIKPKAATEWFHLPLRNVSIPERCLGWGWWRLVAAREQWTQSLGRPNSILPECDKHNVGSL